MFSFPKSSYLEMSRVILSHTKEIQHTIFAAVPGKCGANSLCSAHKI